jgi:inner membrane protein
VQVDGTPATVLPGTGAEAHARGLHIELTDARMAAGATPLAASITLELLGTTRLALVPAAQDTQFNLKSDWPHPSFGGRFLPASREVSALGFNARWAVSALASSAAADALRGGEVCSLAPVGDYNGNDGQSGNDVMGAQASAKDKVCLDTLAVSFIDPVNPYVLTDRATKYALLFIVLTFACVALTEALSGRRVHPVQYTLVGLALALFYLLLLSLSEHIAFGQAYAAASSSCVLLLGFYARHMLGHWRAGLAFGAGVALLYGALWVLLQMEQTALVIGTLLLFAMLAAVMVLTRHVDWYALFNGLRRPAQAGRGMA